MWEESCLPCSKWACVNLLWFGPCFHNQQWSVIFCFTCTVEHHPQRLSILLVIWMNLNIHTMICTREEKPPFHQRKQRKHDQPSLSPLNRNRLKRLVVELIVENKVSVQWGGGWLRTNIFNHNSYFGWLNGLIGTNTMKTIQLEEYTVSFRKCWK